MRSQRPATSGIRLLARAVPVWCSRWRYRCWRSRWQCRCRRKRGRRGCSWLRRGCRLQWWRRRGLRCRSRSRRGFRRRSRRRLRRGFRRWRGFGSSRRLRRRGRRRSNSQRRMAPNCLLFSVCVLDDAGKGISALHGGSGDYVGKAVAPYEGEKHGLPGHAHLECVKAGADEGEALRQRLLHLGRTRPGCGW